MEMYLNGNWAVRHFFWMRPRLITSMIERLLPERSDCLDFGGGSGVFHPTLSRLFRTVTCVDLDQAEAAEIGKRFGLLNVELIRGDVSSIDVGPRRFQAIVAADVLEHFKDLCVPALAIHRWLSDDGLLFTSLPTENWVYRLLRIVFKKEKPLDHYHSAAEVEAYLSANGFRKVAAVFVPLYVPLFPLFAVSAWKKQS